MHIHVHVIMQAKPVKFGELTENVGIRSLFIHSTQQLVSISILNLFSCSLLVLFCSLDLNLAQVIIASAFFTYDYSHKCTHTRLQYCSRGVMKWHWHEMRSASSQHRTTAVNIVRSSIQSTSQNVPIFIWVSQQLKFSETNSFWAHLVMCT